jgi:sugar phosphate isomerase/epimerase
VSEPSARPRTAHDLGASDLVLSHFSLSRFHPIEERIALAAHYGFAGIGLWVGHYAQLEDEGWAPGQLRDLLDEHGVLLAEIEVIPGLGADGQGDGRAGELEALAWRMADEFNCRYLQVIGPAQRPPDEAARAFGSLCDRAADHGLVVGLEFLPFTDIVSVHDARRIVETAARPNGGVCLDVWHHVRGANDLEAIAALPGELITGIQMNDGSLVPEHPDYYQDCLENRRAPGAGEFDLPAFVAAVRSTGTQVPWSVEIPSLGAWANPEPYVAASAQGMREVLAS